MAKVTAARPVKTTLRDYAEIARKSPAVRSMAGLFLATQTLFGRAFNQLAAITLMHSGLFLNILSCRMKTDSPEPKISNPAARLRAKHQAVRDTHPRLHWLPALMWRIFLPVEPVWEWSPYGQIGVLLLNL